MYFKFQVPNFIYLSLYVPSNVEKMCKLANNLT